jgi:prolyl oligopeptidase
MEPPQHGDAPPRSRPAKPPPRQCSSDGRQPPARVDAVVDSYHGTQVADSYRWMEAPSPELDDWLAAQNMYARACLSALPDRDALRDELRTANRDLEDVQILRVVGDKPLVFALRRGANDEAARLVVRSGWRGADRLLIDPGHRGGGGTHSSIDYAYPSPDGRYVAFTSSKAGGEDNVLEVVEVQSGELLPDRIERVRGGLLSWRPDNRSSICKELSRRRARGHQIGTRTAPHTFT